MIRPTGISCGGRWNVKRQLRSVTVTITLIAGVAFIFMPGFMPKANAANGSAIATGGNGGAAPACAACHGNQGEGRPDAGYPRLAGLQSEYLIRQLNAFAEGERDNETMRPIAKALAPDERRAVAAFYAASTAPKIEQPKAPDGKTIASGLSLAERGDWSKGLPGCGQCHGLSGQGVGTTFPRLAGQSAEYLSNQLKAWKDGKRANDPLHLMTGISSKLSDDQVAAVSGYYASLPAEDVPVTPPHGAKP